MSNEKSVSIPIPDAIRADIIDAVESGAYPGWFYPKTVDESLTEYTKSRRGRFDSVGFEVFPEDSVASVHRDSPVETPPEPLIDAIEQVRKPVYRESYTLRFQFSDESWETVENVTLDAYFVIQEPTDL